MLHKKDEESYAKHRLASHETRRRVVELTKVNSRIDRIRLQSLLVLKNGNEVEMSVDKGVFCKNSNEMRNRQWHGI